MITLNGGSPMTPAQKDYIEAIVETLNLFDVTFDGQTKKEASQFITKYQYYYRDMRRLEVGKLPYWSMVVNLPPQDETIQTYMKDAYNDLLDQGEAISNLDLQYYGEGEWGL